MNAVYYPPVVTADDDRRTVVAYFGETYRNDEGAPTLGELASARYRMRWFDPRTGSWRLIGEDLVPVDGRLTVPGKPDPATDWVLVAEASGAV